MRCRPYVHKVVQMKKQKERSPTSAIPLARARQLLSPLVQQLSRESRTKVPISVRGQVRAYMVSARRLEQLEALERGPPDARRRTIRGSVKLLTNLSEPSPTATEEHERAALESWDRAMRRGKG